MATSSETVAPSFIVSALSFSVSSPAIADPFESCHDVPRAAPVAQPRSAIAACPPGAIRGTRAAVATRLK